MFYLIMFSIWGLLSGCISECYEKRGITYRRCDYKLDYQDEILILSIIHFIITIIFIVKAFFFNNYLLIFLNIVLILDLYIIIKEYHKAGWYDI